MPDNEEPNTKRPKTTTPFSRWNAMAKCNGKKYVHELSDETLDKLEENMKVNGLAAYVAQEIR